MGREGSSEPPRGEGQGSLGSSFLESNHTSPPLLWVSLESLQPPIMVEEGGHPFASQRRDWLRKDKRGISLALPVCT